MDIAYYISDLLGQQGELTVPNLGYFVQIRKSAYYDNQAKKFFPPHYLVQFDPQVIDEDESLAKHITGVKNISLASAKYFIEKYVANLKSQAVIENVPFANLGSFSSDGLKLIFSSGTKTDDPAFFAFSPVDVYKIGDTKVKKTVGKSDFLTEAPAPTRTEPVQTFASAATPLAAPVTAAPEPAVTAEPETEEYYEEEPRRVFGTWIIILIVLVLLVGGLGALYKFKPDVFNKIIPLHKKDTTAIAKPAAPVVDYKKDSLERVRTDSIAAVQAAQRDSLAKADSITKAAVKPAAQPEVKQPEVIKQPEAKKPESVVTETKKPAATVVKAPVNIEPAVTANLGGGEMPAEIPRGWYIVTAFSSATKKPGEKVISEMKSRGFVQARFATTKVGQAGNYLVILAAFPTKQDAVDKMKELKATGKITDSEMSLRKF